MACELAKTALTQGSVRFTVNGMVFVMNARERIVEELNGGMMQDGCLVKLAGRHGAGMVGGCSGCGLHVAILLTKPEV